MIVIIIMIIIMIIIIIIIIHSVIEPFLSCCDVSAISEHSHIILISVSLQQDPAF